MRGEDGELKVASEHKRFRAAEVENPLLRGPARHRRDLRAAAAGAPPAAGGEAAVPAPAGARGDGRHGARRAGDQGLVAPEPARAASSSAACSRSRRPCSRCAARELAAYHGAEHISIGSYEHGEPRAREHERCGSHLLGPLVASSAIGGALAAKAPKHLRGPARAAAQLGAVAVSTELFGWMTRNPDKPLSRALAWPGHELQHRLATAEPTPEQLEVAEAALAACLELEHAAAASN